MGSGKLGIVGYGNMGSAIIRGLINAGIYKAKDIYVFDIESAKCEAASRDGCIVLNSAAEVCKSAETVILAVKPNIVCDVLSELAGAPSGTLIISIAAGVGIGTIESVIADKPVIRVMPNTPCMIGEGASVVARGKNACDEHVEKAMEIMGSLGYVNELPEHLMDAVTGLSGSGPAYVALFIDGLTDGGVKMGLPRPIALRLAAQTVFGAAKMIIDHDITPSMLRDMVTSPGGTTIEGISVLESRSFRSALIDAVEAATWKSEELG